MSKVEQESWVTTAANDTEAFQAWCLAISLKHTYTRRKLTVILSKNVSPAFVFTLREEFHLVVNEPTPEEVQAICGIVKCRQNKENNHDLLAWLAAWTLTIWSKCVYLSPNTLVLENCDNLFEHEEIAIVQNETAAVFVLKPDLNTFKLLHRSWNEMNCYNLKDILGAVFHESLSPLGKCYCMAVDEANNLDKWVEMPNIIAFTQAWTLNSEHWLKVYHQNIVPKIQAMEPGLVKTHLMDFVTTQNLPKLKQVPEFLEVTNTLPQYNEEILHNSISIVGMSCRFTESNNADEFWQLLAEGRDGVHAFPAGRRNAYPNADVEGVEGGFLKCPIDEFDAKFFGISPREAELIDPQQRLLLEVIWEALEHAGIPPGSLKETNTGCYLGIWQQDYETYIGTKDLSTSDSHHRYLGNAFSATSSRISYFLGLLGPNVAVESGCSSSLSAFHLACESLRHGEISMAIASGVNLTLGVTKSQVSSMVVLSKDYRCKTFDESANGFVRSEGCGALILKRTFDAVRDGDNILAIIRGSAMNNDGTGTSFGTPNAASQERVFRQALKNAGVKAKDVSYIEAHGTGTAVGDPIEINALSRVYSEGRDRDRPIHIASVKSNIGHTESTAGIAGVIKIILAFQHRKIPPHLHLRTLNPLIDLEAIPAIIPSELTDWIPPPKESGHEGIRLAAVSSFSLSGTNVHVILQEPPENSKATIHAIAQPQVPELITLSAKSQDSLKALAYKYVTYIMENQTISFKDLAYNTNLCRAHNFMYRIAVTGKDLQDTVANIQKQDYWIGQIPSGKPKIGFLFTGQGCQYIGMAQNLYHTSPPFAAAFDKCKQLFQQQLGTNLVDVIWHDESLLQSTAFCQPAIFCVQYSLLKHWAALGVHPDYVLGHSVGEFAAAVAAGVFTLEQAMTLVVERSHLVNSLPRSGMLVLKCSHDKVKSLLKSFLAANSVAESASWVDVAAINSQAEVVVSSTNETIARLELYCANNHVKCQKLTSSHAFHSRSMNSILPEFETVVRQTIETLRSTSLKKPTLKCMFISGTKSKVMEMDELLNPTYWTEHLRRTVRFSDAIQVLAGNNSNGQSQTCNILLEIGPQPILLSLAMANLDTKRRSDELLYCPSLRRAPNDSDWNIMLANLARLYIAGVDLDWSLWYAPMKGKVRKLSVPTYAFDRQKYWYDREEHEGSNFGASSFNLGTRLCHPILGRQIPCPIAETVYCQSISTVTLPYVTDHKIGGKIILPGAVYLEAALAVGKELLGQTLNTVAIPLTVQNLNIQAALEVDYERATQMQTVVSCTKPQEEGNNSTPLQYAISFHRPMDAGQADNWKCHAKATFHPLTATSLSTDSSQKVYKDKLHIEEIKSRLTSYESLQPLYEALIDKGIEFGPKFQSVDALWTGANEVLTVIRLPMDDEMTKNSSKCDPGYICHPIVIDAMFQTCAYRTALNSILAKEDKLIWLPMNIFRFTWMGRVPSTQKLYSYSSGLMPGADDGTSHEGETCLYDEAGIILAIMEGLEFVKISVESFMRALRAESILVPDFYQEKWAPRLGVTQGRYDLTIALQNVTTQSKHTAEQIERIVPLLTELRIGLSQTDLMCFYYVVKCIQECEWPWPEPSINPNISYDLWKDCLGEQLKGTRIHYSFMASLAKEEYVELGEHHHHHRTLRPLPSIAECEEKIHKLQEEIPALLTRDIKFYEFALHCSEQLTAIVKNQTTPLSVLLPSDTTKIGAFRMYNESEPYNLYSDLAVALFTDLIQKIIPSDLNVEDELRPKVNSGNVLRILEVGAGTGATSSKLIKLLQDIGIKYEYMFTDISHQFLDKAQEQFGTATTNVQYKILNIEHDPLEQGFCPHNYDIVLAFHVLHATRNLEVSIYNIQQLMRPHGALMIMETMNLRHYTNVSFALLDDWWRFNDFRTNSPLASREQWLQVLGRCGLEIAAVLQTDGEGIIIGRAPPESKLTLIPFAESEFITQATKKTWIFFGNKSILSHKIATRLKAVNRSINCVIPTMTLNKTSIQQVSTDEYKVDFENVNHFKQVFESILTGRNVVVEGVVYFCNDDAPGCLDQIAEIERSKMVGLLNFMQNLSANNFNSTRNRQHVNGSNEITSEVVQKVKPKVFVVASGIHYLGDQNPGNPADATVWGAFRSFINECRDFNCCIVDIDQDQNTVDESSVDELCAQFWNTGNLANKAASQTHVDNDKFIAIRGGKKYVHRLEPMDKPSSPLLLPINTERYTFINPSSGSLSDIQIGPETSRPIIADGRHVEVAIRAVALNFRDLLCVLKPPGFEKYIKPSADTGYDVGGDISGVVVAVGDQVTEYCVGDEVFGFTTAGGIKSHTVVHESYLMRKPSWMTFTSAATVPVVFLTSYYCLLRLANLKQQDRLLIHVATGGVGLSTIQIAKQIDCTIYATAGSKRKRAYLRQHFGLTHVYNSRNLDYGPAVMKDTNGAGVTVVLNSLTSTGFKETTLDCCAKGAQFIEIGKLNIWGAVEVAELRPDVRYCVVDLSSTDKYNKDVTRHVFSSLNRNFEDRTYKPLPYTVFALERLRDAFYYFQEAKHIGKIVIKMPTVEVNSTSALGRLVLKHNFFDPESTYLITGGLGGLGVEVTKWMSGTGAKHVVLAGRNPPSPQLNTILDQISTASGCEIVTCQTDVGDYEQCVALLDKIKTSSLPQLRGIFHAAGVIADSLVQNQSWEKFNAVFHPKVYGAWWLHKLTLDYDLEFFTMFSSVVAVMGMMGQSTHAAACRFLDSLAYYRIAMGLPGATINWGAWSDVGAAASLKIGQEGLIGIRAFTPSQGINALEQFMLQNYTQACVVDVPDWSIVKEYLNLGSFLGELKTNNGNGSRNADVDAKYAKFAVEIKNCAPEELQAKVQEYLEFIVRRTLRLAPSDIIDPDQNFSEIGVDSLMAMEVRNRVQGMLEESNKSLSIQALQYNNTLRKLSTHLANLLNGSEHVSEDIAAIELLQQESTQPDDIIQVFNGTNMKKNCT